MSVVLVPVFDRLLRSCHRQANSMTLTLRVWVLENPVLVEALSRIRLDRVRRNIFLEGVGGFDSSGLGGSVV
jgi:hypothetical protein